MAASATSKGEDIASAVERALDLAGEREDLGAFWALDREGALGQVAKLERGRPGGPPMPLAGVTVAVKDLFDLAGLPTTAGLPGDWPSAGSDAGLVRRLRLAGAVPVGKAAMDPLGLTTGGQAPGFSPCLNPVDPALSPGGSSSGSAVAVAAGITRLGLGSDTAGSVRIPAAYCGIAALKPGLGRLRRSGMLGAMGRWDIPGVMAATIAECVAAFEVLSGRAAPRPRSRRLRIGVLTDLLADSDPAVAARCQEVAASLGDRFKLEEVELGWDAKGFGLILACEFEAAWGERVDREPERFPRLAVDMVDSAREAGAAGFASVSRSQEAERDRIRRRLGSFDAFIAPTVPVPAPDRKRERVAQSTRFTRIFSALGWPAASVPAGDEAGGPIGVQISAFPSRFGGMLEVAAEVERAGAGKGPPEPG